MLAILTASKTSMLLWLVSSDHLIGPHTSREQPNTYSANRYDDQPRSPQRRLEHYNIDQLIIVYRCGNSSGDASCLTFEQSEQPTPNAVHRRPHADQVPRTCQKKAINDLTERTRDEEHS